MYPGTARSPNGAFAPTPLYVEVIRFAYNLIMASQRICFLQEWRDATGKRFDLIAGDS